MDLIKTLHQENNSGKADLRSATWAEFKDLLMGANSVS